jgi:hypothetical protein
VKKIFLLVFLFLTQGISAQVDIPQEIIDQLESYIEEDADEADLLNLYERLLIYYESSLNINNATYEQLTELGLLSDIQINDLLNHRSRYGAFIRIEELQSIESFSIELIKILQYFLKVTDSEKLNLSITEMLSRSENTVFVKWSQFLEDKKGYIPDEDGKTSYAGDKNRLLVRWRNNFSVNQRMGIILEKDSGEELFKSANNAGFDYMSFHYYLKDYSSLLKELAIGDYTVSMGQGLIAHNDFGGRKSAFVSNVRKGGRAVRPYNSVLEGGYHRGVAATLGVANNLNVTVFGSMVDRDGSTFEVDTLDPDRPELPSFSGFQISGNHRTTGEIEDKGAIGLQTIGGIIKYSNDNYSIGFNILSNTYDGTITRSDALYNKYRYDGDRLNNASIDYHYRYRNINVFGESALSSTDGGTAHLVGALLGLSRKLSATVMYRNYGIKYNAILPNAFGESTNANNETGIYLGLEYRIDKKWTMRAYADFWRHPWLRFGISRPSDGKEFLYRIDYYLKRKLQVYMQYSYESKLADYSTTSAIKRTGPQSRHRLRINFDHIMSKSIRLRSRFEASRFEDSEGLQHGYLVYQDVILQPQEFPLSMTGRVAFFDTDDFDSRIFAYENSVLNEFAVPSFFDQGIRYYLTLRYRATRKMTLEFRIARTHYTRLDLRPDPNSIFFIESTGSGNEEIFGNKRTELKAQLRYKF